MSEREFTSDEIEAGIAHAVKNCDFHIIPALVKLLAVQDPTRAQAVLDALYGRVKLEIQL
jgi:hypothetical protein